MATKYILQIPYLRVMRYNLLSFLLYVFTYLIFNLNVTAQVGINTDTPSQALDINGKIEIGDDGTTPTEGTIRYNATTKTFEGFDGIGWRVMSEIKNLNDVGLTVTSTLRNEWVMLDSEIPITETGDYLVFYQCSLINIDGASTNNSGDGSVLVQIVSENNSGIQSLNTFFIQPYQDTTFSGILFLFRPIERVSDFISSNLEEGSTLKMRVQVTSNGVEPPSNNEWYVSSAKILAIKTK